MDFTKVKENLEKKGYKVSVFENKEAATDYICAQCNGLSIGFGGSMTLKEMGLYEKLSENNEVHWHWMSKEPDIFAKEAAAPVYMSSVNGLAETGEMVNIDGAGNRVASIFFGHEKVYLIAGSNKIAENLEKAHDRAKNIAAPLNAVRLGRNTPCAVKGDKCYDCQSPDRICTETAILTRHPMAGSIEVILIDEPLGY